MGDVFGALQGRGLGAFSDIEELTMFADYRVPVVLRVMSILKFSPELTAKVRVSSALVSSCIQKTMLKPVMKTCC